MSNIANKFTYVFITVLVSMVASVPPIAVLWGITHLGFFGIIFAPPAALDRWFMYMVVVLTATALIFGSFLREGLRMSGLKITSKQSFIIGFLSPIFLVISIGIISLTQYADGHFDGLTALGGFVLTLCSAIILSQSFSKSSKDIQ